MERILEGGEAAVWTRGGRIDVRIASDRSGGADAERAMQTNYLMAGGQFEVGLMQLRAGEPETAATLAKGRHRLEAANKYYLAKPRAKS
jgi:hypothetical protein